MEIGSGPNSPNKNTNNNINNNNLLNRLDTLDHPPSKRLLTTSNSKHLLTQPQITATTPTPIETNEELVDEEIIKMDSSATIKQENDKQQQHQEQQLESCQLTNNETTTTTLNVDQNDNENIDDGLFN